MIIVPCRSLCTKQITLCQADYQLTMQNTLYHADYHLAIQIIVVPCCSHCAMQIIIVSKKYLPKIQKQQQNSK
jgi:hypothetical protein